MKYIKALILVVFIAVAPACVLADADGELTLLFTTDIHSNIEKRMTWIDGKAQMAGGFARLKSAVDENRVSGRTLLFDSGDFTVGTLYQSFTKTDALELTLMRAIGYDAAALGNHDFDLGEDGLCEMLDTFEENGGGMEILCSNLVEKGQKTANIGSNPLEKHGVKNYAVFETGGLRVGVFAMMGTDAIQFTATESLAFADQIDTAKAAVQKLRADEKADVVIMLSHCGLTPDGKFTQDADIAKAVDGIDVILSGHTHVPLGEAIKVGKTTVVCAGTALDYLGRLDLRKNDGKWDAEYKLIPLGDEWPENGEIAAMIKPYTQRIASEYLEKFGVNAPLDEAFGYSPCSFMGADYMIGKVDNYALGALITDAYLYAAKLAGITDISVAAVPVGVIRSGIFEGEITVADVYNMLSFGSSPIDGSAASSMVACRLTGREIYDMCETSASLSAIVGEAQILFGGLRYYRSNARPLLNKVALVEARDPVSGEYKPVARDDKTLYGVVCSLTALKSISLVSSRSYGLLTIEPKDDSGRIVDTDEEFVRSMLTLPDGTEIKEWYSLYAYIKQMPKNERGLSVISAEYEKPADFIREIQPSFATFFVNPNKAAWIQYALVLFVLALVIAIPCAIKRRANKKHGSKH